MEVIRRSDERHPAKGLLAGAAAGLIAAWAMNQFQAAWSKASEQLKSGEQKSQSQNSQSHEREDKHEEKEDATMKAAGKLAQPALGRNLSKQEKKKAGPIVHYLFGTIAGAAYGLVGEYLPMARVGFGTVFGATLFLLADELAVPALGLSGSATEAPLSSHLYGLSSHLVYGASAEGIRRGIAKAG